MQKKGWHSEILGVLGGLSTQGNWLERWLCILHSVTASQAEAGVWVLYQREETPFVLELIVHYWGKVIILE